MATMISSHERLTKPMNWDSVQLDSASDHLSLCHPPCLQLLCMGDRQQVGSSAVLLQDVKAVFLY